MGSIMGSWIEGHGMAIIEGPGMTPFRTPSGYPKRGPPHWSLIPPLLGGLIGQNHRTESYPRALRKGSDQKWVQKGVLNGVPKMGLI